MDRINALLHTDEQINLDQIKDAYAGKTVLVTGGGGSIGTQICKLVAQCEPKLLIILDNYENNAYLLREQLQRRFGNKCKVKISIASIQDADSIERVFFSTLPDIVFHAAAHKHLPLVEENPLEGIKNNIFGTFTVATMCGKYSVQRFVLISTDKAVNPTSVMGYTKRCGELLISSLNQIYADTIFSSVRFGNVIGSKGSVLELFTEQVAKGGPVTVTHKDATRFFMSIPQAALLVLKGMTVSGTGDIAILEMGEPISIVALAKRIIGDKNIPILFTGLRVGEKLTEQLTYDYEQLLQTKYMDISRCACLDIPYSSVKKHLSLLRNAVDVGDVQTARNILVQMTSNQKCFIC